MENNVPGPSKGYQKQIKIEAATPRPLSKTKGSSHPDYSSPAAKKWPQFVEAIEGGDVEAVKQLVEEGINVNVVRDGVTPLMIAASKGKTEIAEVIIQAGANINERTDDGWTALHNAACDQADAGVVDLLMQSGIDIEAKNKSGKTALQLAEEKKHRDIVTAIIKHKHQLLVDAQEWDTFLNTAEGKPYRQQRQYESLSLVFKFWWLPLPVFGVLGLLLGALFSSVILAGIVGLAFGTVVGGTLFLWERNIRNYLDALGPLPFLDIHTLREKRKAGETISINKGIETTMPVETAEEQPAGTEPDDGASDILLEQEDEIPTAEPTVISKPQTPPRRTKQVNLAMIIAVAVAIAIVSILGVLVVQREAITKWYYVKKIEKMGIPFSDQSFLNEVSKNNEGILDLFVKAGVNLDAKNEKGQTALMIATEKGYENMHIKLIQLNARVLNDVDKSGNTALMVAARQGRENIVKSLVEKGANVNFTVPSQEGAATALQAAVDVSDFREEHLRIVQYLVQHGADARGRNISGRFPLLFAVDHGRTEAAKVLIEYGADVNAADQKGNFSLLTAACKGYPLLVTLLAEKGADMNMALPDGYTPLMCAVRENHLETINALLEKNANVNAKTAGGLTALTDATRMGNVSVVKLFLRRGADPASGFLPESFNSFRGKSLTINLKKKQMRDVMKAIAKTAALDGYTINVDSTSTQPMTLQAKGSWNKVLLDIAKKYHLLLVVNEKEVFVLEYNAASVKRAAAWVSDKTSRL